MFSAMSYGSISYNAHESLARAAVELGTYYNTGEGGLHRGLLPIWGAYHRAGGLRTLRRAQGLSRMPARPLKSKWARAPSRASAATCPGQKIVGDISRTRMIPEGSGRHFPRPAP